MKKVLHVAFGADINYVMQCEIALLSLCENNSEIELFIHILAMCEDSELAKFDYVKTICERYKQKCEIIQVKQENFEGMPESSYISKATYLRLLLPQLLKDNVEQVLYLDSDIVVLGDLTYFIQNPLQKDEACAAAIDVNGQSIKHHNRIGIPAGEVYHNAGVLYMNLTYWRSHDVSRKAIENIRKFQYAFQDQDAINALLYSHIRTISYKYNFQTSHLLCLFSEQEIDKQYHNDLEEAMRTPIIIHYASYRKPWQKECPLQQYWLQYKQQSRWKDMPLQKSKHNRDTVTEALYQAKRGREGLYARFAPVYYKLFYYAANTRESKLWFTLINLSLRIEILLMKCIHLVLKKK